jgi:vacuolar protein sorting-associated protein 45
MQKLIENFPEFKQGERNCTKHFNLIEAIRTKITDKNLYVVSELEQDMCNTSQDDKNSYFNRIQQAIQDPKTQSFEKLKLVILFCIRYENDQLCN